MNLPSKKGLSFGLTSGVITTLGLIIGLNSSTQSLLAVISGILIIAIADALSDALGVHISEEASTNLKPKDLWLASFYTFLAKLITALTFIVPFIFFSLNTAVVVCIAWGLLLVCIMSYFIAKSQKTSVAEVVLEHLVVSILVIVLTAYIGQLIRSFIV